MLRQLTKNKIPGNHKGNCDSLKMLKKMSSVRICWIIISRISKTVILGLMDYGAASSLWSQNPPILAAFDDLNFKNHL